MEQYCSCAECGSRAELRFEDREERKNGKVLRLKRVPYYLCPVCGEPTYDFHIELKIEQLIKSLKGSKTVNLEKAFY